MLGIVGLAAIAQDGNRAKPRVGLFRRDANEPSGQTITLAVETQARTALLFLPSKSPEPKADKTDDPGAPLVFAFHDHHGHRPGTTHRFQIQKLWPAAIAV